MMNGYAIGKEYYGSFLCIQEKWGCEMARRKTFASTEGMEALVGNNDHASIIRGRIMNSAKNLLAREGYNKTTIRKIVEDSGVLTGSIYYFFKNKEDIFHAILLELMRDCIGRINARFKDESPMFKYAAACQVELMVLSDYQVVRESYKEGYDSVVIFEGMIAQFLELARKLFEGTKYQMTDDEYYENTLMVKGAMHACLTEMFFRRAISKARTRQKVIRLAIYLFGGEDEADEILEKLEEYNPVWTEIGRELVERPINQ